MYKLLTIFTSSLLLLSGCGGGGGGSSAPVAPSAVQGVYQGTTSNGKTEDAIVLEDGSFWSMYGVPSGSALAVQGIATGSSTASNGTFTLSFKDFLAPGSSPISGSGSGTYTGSTLIGSFTESGVTTTFNFAAPLATTYDYNTPAVISAITGSWSGSLLNGETAIVNILANGALTGTSSPGCSFTGTVTPRPSGKNVFNISITFGASPCALPNQSASGITLTYPLGNGTSQLISGLITPTQTIATAFFAVR